MGVLLPDVPGKGPVHRGVSPLNLPPGPFKMDVEDGLGEGGAQGEA